MHDFHVTPDGYVVTYSADPIEQMVVSCPVVTRNPDGTDTGERTRCARVPMADAPSPVTEEYVVEVGHRIAMELDRMVRNGCERHQQAPAPEPAPKMETVLSTMTEQRKDSIIVLPETARRPDVPA